MQILYEDERFQILKWESNFFEDFLARIIFFPIFRVKDKRDYLSYYNEEFCSLKQAKLYIENQNSLETNHLKKEKDKYFEENYQKINQQYYELFTKL